MGSMFNQKAESYVSRLDELKKRISENMLDGIILAPGPNLRYLTGINSMLLERPFLLFVQRVGDAHLLAPTLESGPYLRGPVKMTVHSWNDSEGPSRSFEELVREIPLNGKWGLEGRIPFRFIHQLQSHAQPTLQNAEETLQNLREIKEPEEVRHLQRAASILSKSFLHIPNMLKRGISELELARKISQTIYANGAEAAEDILVQSGKFAADPHHLPTSRKLNKNESVVIDAACSYAGYYADITRTFMIGKNPRVEEVYAEVLASQEAAIVTSKSGVTVGSIDSAARNRLKQKNLDEYFIHRTGHGLGLEVHEAPYIIAEGDEIIRPSMVFTIEPGVYVPSKMGVRIEDNIVATQEGCRVSTNVLPREFGWWKR